MLGQRLEEGPSSFPYSVVPEVPPTPSRAAWCYGDPGVVLALLIAARNVGRLDWEEQAIEMGEITARRNPENCGVIDAGLCHGSAGLGLVFGRMYHLSKVELFRQVARDWFVRTLDYRQSEGGIGGFQAMLPKESNEQELAWADDSSFLTGSSGIALALMAAISSVEPDWDRVLLTSTRNIDME